MIKTTVLFLIKFAIALDIVLGTAVLFLLTLFLVVKLYDWITETF